MAVWNTFMVPTCTPNWNAELVVSPPWRSQKTPALGVTALLAGVRLLDCDAMTARGAPVVGSMLQRTHASAVIPAAPATPTSAVASTCAQVLQPGWLANTP